MNKLLEALAADPSLVAGVEVAFILEDGSQYRATIRQGGASNNEYAAELESLFRPYRQSGVDPSDLPIPKQRELIAKALAKTVVVGWNEDDFGEPYSLDACVRTLIKAPPWANFIANQAGKESLFRKRSIEEATGN